MQRLESSIDRGKKRRRVDMSTHILFRRRQSVGLTASRHLESNLESYVESHVKTHVKSHFESHVESQATFLQQECTARHAHRDTPLELSTPTGMQKTPEDNLTTPDLESTTTPKSAFQRVPKRKSAGAVGT